MGACGYVCCLTSKNIKSDIKKMQREAYERSGINSAYSGDINTIDFIRSYSKSFKSNKDLDEYIDSRWDKIGKCKGEIVNLGLDYCVKAHVEYNKIPVEHFFKNVVSVTENVSAFFKKHSISNNYLVFDEKGNFIRSYDKIAGARIAVKDRMFKEEFSTDYYIVSRSLAYHCTGEGDICNKNIKPSDNYLIIPFYKYLLIGWAAE